MALLEKPVPAKKATPPAAGKRVAPKAAAKRAALKRKPVLARNVPRVSVITAGGYTVFGSPVRPAHLTTEQIAQAIAELD